jgi:GNAT superfamily N-acetyltransferase
MIRPVLYVDLPGIIYSLDRRARSKQHELANFVCWLEPVENRHPLPPILRNIFPLNPASRTWICEDHWHLLGFAQARERPSHTMWDIAYLASMVNRDVSSDEVLSALLEYILEMAATHGILRIFAKVEDEIPELELFQRTGFQRYARELTYVYSCANAADVGTSDGANAETQNSGLRASSLEKDALDLPSLRRWSRHHVWGLHQLYRAVTPHKVQMAELLENSEEFAKLHVGSLSGTRFPFWRDSENYVCDVGVRLGAWMRLCRSHGSGLHQLSIMVHPEHAELAEPLLRFGIQRLQQESAQPILCHVREYESSVIAALRNSGFEQTATRALLVRHMALLAMRQRTVPSLEQRVAYGVKGLGTVNSRQTMR